MGYRLRFHQVSDRSEGKNTDDRGYEIEAVRESDGGVFRFTAILTEKTQWALIGRGGLEGAVNEHNEVDKPLQCFAASRFERALRNGTLPLTAGDAPASAVAEFVGHDDFPEIFAAVKVKECSYRLARGPNFYCLATRNGGNMPTTPPICRECPVPDARWACSHLAHATLDIKFGADGEPTMSSPRAMCNRGMPEIRDLGLCRPGGHKCWERIVEPQSAGRSRPFVPEALPEALDSLHATWCLAFGKNRRLLHLRSAADTAALVGACSTRKDFVACMSALDDVIKSMKIADELLSEGDRIADETKGDKTLNRLEACLQNNIPDAGLKQAGIEAIAVLRSANRIRVALQHSARSEDLPKVLASFDLSPTDDWADFWTGVRARVTEALVDLRKALGPLTDLG